MQKNGSPQRRRVRGGKIFCLSGDDDKQKGLQPLRGKAAASGNHEAPVVWFVAAGLSGFVQSLSPDWTKIRLSLRSLRLCGGYRFSMKIMKNMYKNLLPWRLYDNIFEINFDELNRLGVKNYFFDFDNTLMRWGSNTISERVKEFLNKLKQEGFSIYIVTNGKGSRYKILQSSLPQDVTVLQNMKKPNPEKFKDFLQRHNINPHDSVFIGDNLMTDIKLGNKIGCITIKVKPICFREFFGTKFYRFLELFVYLFNSQYFTKLKEPIPKK